MDLVVGVLSSQEPLINFFDFFIKSLQKPLILAVVLLSDDVLLLFSTTTILLLFFVELLLLFCSCIFGALNSQLTFLLNPNSYDVEKSLDLIKLLLFVFSLYKKHQ